jgi:outer membrane receptor for ferrienterochelin and colicins
MRNRFLVVLCALALATSAAFAQANGRISGFVTQEEDGTYLSGVTVVLNESGEAMVTGSTGAFFFSGLAPGDYSISFSLGDNVATETGIKVNAGATTVVQMAVDWDLSFADTITVFGASRRTERIVEAPAAVTVISQDEIELEGGNGQLPKLVEFAPGVDFTQSGLYDINFNTRGFNSSLNRRILNLIDGRDASVPFLGASEWAAVSFATDELQSAELVRGPGSALYGANAFNGVLNMVTKNPRYNQGGMVRLTGGELGMKRIDARYAGGFGSDWYYRATAGYQESEDFTRSRNVTVEYPGLPREAVPLALEEGEIKFGGLRFDKFFESGRVLTFEGGQATLEGPTFMTGIGRVQTTGVDRPWARANFNTEHWNWLAYYDARQAEDQVALASGALLWEDSSNLHVEVQGNIGLFSDKLRLVGGASYHEQDIDTSNPAGFHTLMPEAKKEDQQAAFAQADWSISDTLKLVVAGRYDDNTLLEDAEFSPKGSVVWSPTSNHGVRLSFNRAFQVPNYSEFFLRVPAGRPIQNPAFGQLEAGFCTRFGVVCGFNNGIPIFALGNDALDVEEIETYEIGYTGIFGGKLFMTVDYYQSELSNFVTDLLPGVNPAYPFYTPPAGIPAPVAALLVQTLRGLPAPLNVGLTNLNGVPTLVISYTNAGEVETEGAELAFNYYLGTNWILDASYSWFDFEVKEQALGDRLFPNAPEHKYNLGVTYRGGSFDASLKYRWVDEFFWAAGIFQGNVPDYYVVDLAANYRLNDRISFGLDISNLTDDAHWEAFGGDIIERRALGSVTFRF